MRWNERGWDESELKSIEVYWDERGQDIKMGWSELEYLPTYLTGR